jgi:hypothetical protein
MSEQFVVKVAAPATEVSRAFLQGMANRMSTSFFKYGPLADNYPTPGHALDSLQERLKRYQQTGNTEWLMDVANFAMIEFLRPTHEEAHFRATDSDESPGVALWVGGHAKDRIADHRDSA